MKLKPIKPNCEVVGKLSDIKFEGDYLKLVLTAAWEVELPKDTFSREQLQDFLNQRVGVINLDGKHKIRLIKK